MPTRGKFVATTEDGKLKFADKKKKKVEDDRPAQPRAAQAKPEARPQTVKPEETKKKTGKEGEGDQLGETTETLTVAFGRFNPPTVGHGKLLAAFESGTG